MTEEEKKQCYNDFKTIPNSKGILLIEAEQLNSTKNQRILLICHIKL